MSYGVGGYVGSGPKKDTNSVFLRTRFGILFGDWMVLKKVKLTMPRKVRYLVGYDKEANMIYEEKL